eukprot:g59611.t1
MHHNHNFHIRYHSHTNSVFFRAKNYQNIPKQKVVDCDFGLNANKEREVLADQQRYEARVRALLHLTPDQPVARRENINSSVMLDTALQHLRSRQLVPSGKPICRLNFCANSWKTPSRAGPTLSRSRAS